ncbi:hypothetical protein R5R35_006393 [Gryllus longicercus]|uniref:Uncharacterized protein n=1 Tax=Gryllus longicercus TaxID=2509291 RepID=A0AAN9WMW6_9ORTH
MVSNTTSVISSCTNRAFLAGRFCVGDRFYLCDNKILCEYDYEERLVFAHLAVSPSGLALAKRQAATPTGSQAASRGPPPGALLPQLPPPLCAAPERSGGGGGGGGGDLPPGAVSFHGAGDLSFDAK